MHSDATTVYSSTRLLAERVEAWLLTSLSCTQRAMPDAGTRGEEESQMTVLTRGCAAATGVRAKQKSKRNQRNQRNQSRRWIDVAESRRKQGRISAEQLQRRSWTLAWTRSSSS